MSDSFLGSIVLIDCGPVLGTYQGLVSDVDKMGQTISVTHVMHNCLPCSVPQVTISAADIHNLKIVHAASEMAPPLPTNVVDFTVAPPVITTANHTQQFGQAPLCHQSLSSHDLLAYHSEALTSGTKLHKASSFTGNLTLAGNGFSSAPYEHGFGSSAAAPTKHEDTYRRVYIGPEGKSALSTPRKVSTPRKIESRRRAHKEDCFSAPIETILDEFDFEKNLALFDKQAVFSEIDNLEGNSPVDCGKPTNYRCNENVLAAKPIVFHQIKVPGGDETCEYVTDSGLVVPSITYELRHRLLATAEKYGLNADRQVETVGRSASEMVLQLLGGGHRLNPQNAHQRPSVVVLCGPNQQGAQAVSCARHLATHNVLVTVFVADVLETTPSMETELELYDLTFGKKFSHCKDLPRKPVDVIISALNGHSDSGATLQQEWYQSVTDWANQNKASVLAIDPPAEGGDIKAKWSLALALPLTYSDTCGQVYLCDLAIPQKIFKEVGITYRSPFAHKFVIPLHINS